MDDDRIRNALKNKKSNPPSLKLRKGEEID